MVPSVRTMTNTTQQIRLHTGGQMNEFACQNARTLNHHFGELIALKWIRQMTDCSLIVARMVLRDCIANERWTYPHAKIDLNDWQLPNGCARDARHNLTVRGFEIAS